MIQVKIHLDKKSTLFKNFKKRGFIDKSDDSVFIWLGMKPCIGELIAISSYCVDDKNFQRYLQNKNDNVYLRIMDLCQRHMMLKSEKEGINVISIKCIEEIPSNWNGKFL